MSKKSCLCPGLDSCAGFKYAEWMTIKHALALKLEDPLAQKLFDEISEKIERFRDYYRIKRGTDHDEG